MVARSTKTALSKCQQPRPLHQMTLSGLYVSPVHQTDPGTETPSPGMSRPFSERVISAEEPRRDRLHRLMELIDEALAITSDDDLDDLSACGSSRVSRDSSAFNKLQ